MRVLAVAVLVLPLAACTPAGPPRKTGPTLPATPAVPKCSSLFHAGKILPKPPEPGGVTCVNQAGATFAVAGRWCRDGTFLWQVDARTGAPEGWGVSGGMYHLGKAADDPGYAKAYNNCVG